MSAAIDAGREADVEAMLAAVGWRGGGVTEVERADGSIAFRARTRVKGRLISAGVWATREEALAAVKRVRERLAADVDLPAVDSLRDYGEKILDRREKRGRVRGIYEERCHWRTHVLAADFADFPVRGVTRGMVVRWVNARLHEGRRTKVKRCKVNGEWTIQRELTDKPISRGTVVHALRVLRLVFKAALDEELLDGDPTAGVRVPRVDDSRETWTWLRPHEIDLVERYEDEGARLLWTLAIYTGLRKGELAGLRWADVRLEERYPHLVVQRSYRLATKSGALREVPLLPPALAAVKRWRQLRPGLPGAQVFPSPSAGTQQRHWDPGAWKRRAERLLGRAVRFHDLRHTCASHLVQGTWGRALSLYEVGQWLGHADPDTTKRYAHLAPEGLHQRAAEMAAAWKLPS